MAGNLIGPAQIDLFQLPTFSKKEDDLLFFSIHVA